MADEWIREAIKKVICEGSGERRSYVPPAAVVDAAELVKGLGENGKDVVKWAIEAQLGRLGRGGK